MPRLFLPIALLVLGNMKLPGEHDLTDTEAEHAQEQLQRLGLASTGSAQVAPTPATTDDAGAPAPDDQVRASDDLIRVPPEGVLEVLAGHLERGEISPDRVAERLGFALGTVETTDEVTTAATIATVVPPPLPAPPTPPPTAPATPVIPPAVVRELKKVGFDLTKPATIQAADDEALLAVKGMTPELLAQLRQIAG